MSKLEALFAQVKSTESPLSERVAENFAKQIQAAISGGEELPVFDGGPYFEIEHNEIRDVIYRLGRNWVGVSAYNGATNVEVAIAQGDFTYFHHNTLGAGKDHLEAQIANKLTMWQFVHDVEDLDQAGMMCDMSAEQIIEGCTRRLFSVLDDDGLDLAMNYGMYYREALIGFLENYYQALMNETGVYSGVAEDMFNALELAFSKAIAHTPREAVEGVSTEINYVDHSGEYRVYVGFANDSAIGVTKEEAIRDYYDAGAKEAAKRSWYPDEWVASNTH